MKRSLNFVDHRRTEIIHLLEQYGHVKVSFLAKELNVSPLTIRRDLNSLEEHHIITRQYGKAMLLNPGSSGFSSSQMQCKTAIAKKAAALVQDQDSIFINTSSTALLMMQYITANNVTVITNNGKALKMPHNPTLTVALTGGEIRFPKESMFGEFALQNIGRVSANKCFLGCAGLSVEGGLTTAAFQERPVNSMMFERSEKHFVLADYTKIGVTSNFRYGEAENIDLLITNDTAPKSVLTKFKRMGMQIELVKPSENKTTQAQNTGQTEPPQGPVS
ncbi:MAG: DeoR/GlpR family DNA-binding transcription regulator [Oscillospiraceae bacterium]|jgi:DeoR/GlpR family transcriptional regulator of sugar metabolism|nr:DeoR/GlpR family DNA-binding transcription regulator [Oscillospiraceae bacterium]